MGSSTLLSQHQSKRTGSDSLHTFQHGWKQMHSEDTPLVPSTRFPLHGQGTGHAEHSPSTNRRQHTIDGQSRWTVEASTMNIDRTLDSLVHRGAIAHLWSTHHRDQQKRAHASICLANHARTCPKRSHSRSTTLQARQRPRNLQNKTPQHARCGRALKVEGAPQHDILHTCRPYQTSRPTPQHLCTSTFLQHDMFPKCPSKAIPLHLESGPPDPLHRETKPPIATSTPITYIPYSSRAQVPFSTPLGAASGRT